MLDVKNLMVFFENAIALNDFSFQVNEGEIVGVVGPNSAGKTTLMNTLSGLIIDMKTKEKRKGGERITVYGNIVYQGRDITQTKPSERVKRGIVLSRERHPVFPESSVLENLKIAGYLRRKQEIRDGIAFAFHLFPALAALKKKKAGFLSGGEQQMLAIGMALIVKPELLLLDEPLLGLSPMMQNTPDRRHCQPEQTQRHNRRPLRTIRPSRIPGHRSRLYLGKWYADPHGNRCENSCKILKSKPLTLEYNSWNQHHTHRIIDRFRQTVETNRKPYRRHLSRHTLFL